LQVTVYLYVANEFKDNSDRQHEETFHGIFNTHCTAVYYTSHPDVGIDSLHRYEANFCFGHKPCGVLEDATNMCRICQGQTRKSWGHLPMKNNSQEACDAHRCHWENQQITHFEASSLAE
jgi:hypothetical protein